MTKIDLFYKSQTLVLTLRETVCLDKAKGKQHVKIMLILLKFEKQ